MGDSRSLLSDRRTILQLVGAAAGAGVVPSALGQEGSAGSFVLEQDGQCVPVEPLTGDEPVEEFYEYRYPVDRYDGPPGSEGDTYSSHGTTDLQRDDTSVLFLYDGPDGLSLVLVHGRLEGDGAGGTIRFTVDGLPSDGEWVVRDDYYLADGEPVASNFDEWDVDDDPHVVDWAYRGGRTDGGVFRGLGSEFEVRIDPAFDDAAPLSEQRDFGPVESWEALSGDLDEPERRSLRLDQPVTIRSGECPSGTSTPSGDGDGQIVGLSASDGVYTIGEEVPAEVTVENAGDRDHTFYVGYSVIGPDGEPRHNDGTTDEPVTVSAGGTETKTVTWTVERDAPNGSYDAKVALWRNREGGDLQTRLDRRQVASAFQVVND